MKRSEIVVGGQYRNKAGSVREVVAMAHALLLPDGRTAGEAVVADIDGFLAAGGRLPLLLPGPEREG